MYRLVVHLVVLGLMLMALVFSSPKVALSQHGGPSCNYCSSTPQCASYCDFDNDGQPDPDCAYACSYNSVCAGRICTWTQDGPGGDDYQCDNWCPWTACIWDVMYGDYLQARTCCGTPPDERQLRECDPGGGNGGGPTPSPPPGSPSCTVDLEQVPPFAVGINQTFTASVVPSNGTVDNVAFISQDTGIATVNPASDTTVVYSTEVTGVAEGSTNIFANVYMGGVVQCTDTSIATITGDTGAWWQAKDTDILASGNITSTIPATCVGACTPNLILDGDGGYPGVAAYGGSLGVGSGTVSSTDWEVNSASSIRKTFNYDYFSRQIPADVVMNEITTTTIGSSFSGTPTNGYYWYHYDGETYGDLTINANVNLGSLRVIILVDGANLNIDGRVVLNDGSGFFAVFVGKNSSGEKGDIVVNPTVGGSADGVPELEGIFLSDSEFYTGTAGVGADNQLHIRGSIAALGGMVLERDLTDNSDTPAEFFEFAPDLMLLFPKELRTKRFRWEEVAP